MRTKVKTELFLVMLVLNGGLLCGVRAGAAEAGPTNAPVNPANPVVTNQPPNAVVDAEAAEIRRLQALARDNTGRVTNQVAEDAASKLLVQRHQRYREQLKTSNDVVGVAVEIANDKLRQLPSPPEIFTAVGILARHWEDPRSEQMLEAFSASGPHMRGEVERLEGIAYGMLLDVRAKKQLQQITDGRRTEAERTTAIIEFLEKHSELTTVYHGRDYYLRRILYTELEKSDDPKAIRLVFKSGHFTRGFAESHHAEMVAYARVLSGEEALANSPLVEALGRSRDKAVIPLFEKWLPDAKDDRTKQYLVSKTKALREKP